MLFVWMFFYLLRLNNFLILRMTKAEGSLKQVFLKCMQNTTCAGNYILLKLQAVEVFSFTKNKLPQMCFSIVFLELSAISLFARLSGCFWEWQNHAPVSINYIRVTAQKMKFSIKDFFSKCDQIRRNLAVFVMNDLFPDLSYMIFFKAIAQKSKQKHLENNENTCEKHHHYSNSECLFVRIL